MLLLLSIINSQQGDASLYGNKDVEDDSHKVDLPVEKKADDNVINSGEMDKSATEGVKSVHDSAIVEEHIQIAPSQNLQNEVNPVDRNLDEEMIDMETELNNPPNVPSSKLVDYKSTSDGDRE